MTIQRTTINTKTEEMERGKIRLTRTIEETEEYDMRRLADQIETIRHERQRLEERMAQLDEQEAKLVTLLGNITNTPNDKMDMPEQIDHKEGV